MCKALPSGFSLCTPFLLFRVVFHEFYSELLLLFSSLEGNATKQEEFMRAVTRTCPPQLIAISLLMVFVAGTLPPQAAQAGPLRRLIQMKKAKSQGNANQKQGSQTTGQGQQQTGAPQAAAAGAQAGQSKGGRKSLRPRKRLRQAIMQKMAKGKSKGATGTAGNANPSSGGGQTTPAAGAGQ